MGLGAMGRAERVPDIVTDPPSGPTRPLASCPFAASYGRQRSARWRQSGPFSDTFWPQLTASRELAGMQDIWIACSRNPGMFHRASFLCYLG